MEESELSLEKDVSEEIEEEISEAKSLGFETTENESNSQNGSAYISRKQKRLNKKMLRFSIENDRKYKGPLGVFSLRLLAWAFIVLSQVAVVFDVGSALLGNPKYEMVSNVISVFSSLSMPLFLLANFAYIIQRKDNIKKVLATYLFMMIVVAGCFYLLYLHYGVGLIASFAKIPYKDAYDTVGILVMSMFSNTFKFNIFVDLFICTLFVTFFLGNPKKYFVGKKLIIFRLLSLIPLGYELAIIVLKILSIFNIVSIPILMTPFMPTKCPFTFVAFVFIVFSEAIRKRKFFKYGGTITQYKEFFMSNNNSLIFAKSSAKWFALIGVIDLILAITLSIVSVTTENAYLLSTIETLEIGESIGLLLLAPFIILFSYNRMFKPSKFDLFLPILALIAIVIIYLEAGYVAIGMFI